MHADHLCCPEAHLGNWPAPPRNAILAPPFFSPWQIAKLVGRRRIMLENQHKNIEEKMEPKAGDFVVDGSCSCCMGITFNVDSFTDEPKAQCTENDLEQVFSSDPICFWHFYLTLLQSGTGVQHNKWNPVQVFTLVHLLHLVQLAQPTTTANSARIPINCGIKPNADGCCHC